MDLYRDILEKYWGYSTFRPLQEDIIRSVCAGKDTLGLMPTGGGKSITFQVPALAMEGICLVVTPLIALMKDQVDNLRRLGIKATAIYAGMFRHEIIVQLENCIFGDYKFLYVSPERLSTDIFRVKLQAMKVCLLVIDESHCISQWGYDFRPSYLQIADIRKLLPGVPVLALTASATTEVIEDIQQKLGFRHRNVFRKSFYRSNLSYIVRRTDNKIPELIRILKKIPGTTIIYVRNRKRTKEIALILQNNGFPADFFHAGLNREEKNLRQNRWKNDTCPIIVATNAFGMGIDKPDVRLVVHLDMPGSLEEYYQEAGRAGRDEQKAYAVALCSNADAAKLKKRVTNEFPEKKFICRVYEALGNYYQIAVGYGLNTVHDFDLADFAMSYSFPFIQTHHALKILDLSGYIEYTEEIEKVSRILFYATREELYKILRQDKRTDEIIQALLRTYTGVFSQYVYIDERVIATRAACSVQEVYDTLSGLSKIHALHYIPHKKTPLIVFTQTREEQKYVVIPRQAYEERKERFEKRIDQVIDYIKEDRRCRSQLLLSYFGETNTADCGECDVCRAKNKSGLTNRDFNAIRDALEHMLSDRPHPLTELVDTLPFPSEKSITVIRFLLDHDEQFALHDGILSFQTENKPSSPPSAD